MNIKTWTMPVLGFVGAAFLFAGCGGGIAGAPVITAPTPTPVNIQGQWQAVAQSTADATSRLLIEANFTQTGANVVAAKNSVVLLQGAQSGNGITLTGLSGECDNGLLGNDSIQATISNQTQLSFTLTEAGSLGTATSTGTVTISPDGTQITSGSYMTPAACGFVADSGSIVGILIKPFAGTYSGMLANNGSTDAVIVTVSQTGYNLNVVGTDNGAQFTLRRSSGRDRNSEIAFASRIGA